VIGGAGFIGSQIVDQLLDEPVEQITASDNSYAEPATTPTGAVGDSGSSSSRRHAVGTRRGSAG